MQTIFAGDITKLKTQIYKTKNYAAFKTIAGNRNINQNHLVKLINSVAKKNLLAYFPIIVNERFEIIDGQHRYAVARTNNLNLYYIVADGLTLEDARILNANIRAWSMQDYLDSYVKQKIEDYVILQQFILENDIPITAGMAILTKINSKDKAGSLRSAFKAGNFKVTELEYAQDLMDKLSDLRDRLSPGLWRDRNFLWAFMRTENIVDHKRLVEKAAKANWTLERRIGIRDYLRIFEDIYNFKITGERVRLF